MEHHLIRGETSLNPLPAFLKHLLQHSVEPRFVLNMNAMSGVLPLHELGLGHVLLQTEAVARVDQVVPVADEDEHLRDRLGDVPQRVGLDMVRQCRGHL